MPEADQRDGNRWKKAIRRTEPVLNHSPRTSGAIEDMRRSCAHRVDHQTTTSSIRIERIDLSAVTFQHLLQGISSAFCRGFSVRGNLPCCSLYERLLRLQDITVSARNT